MTATHRYIGARFPRYTGRRCRCLGPSKGHPDLAPVRFEDGEKLLVNRFDLEKLDELVTAGPEVRWIG